MMKNLIMLDNVSEHILSEYKKNIPLDSKIFSFNFQTHEKIKAKGIEHDIAEKILSDEDRKKIFDYTISFYNWFKIKQLEILEFEGVNLLGVMDRNELHTYLIHNILQFLTIKRIIEKENPNKIFASTKLFSAVKTLVNKKEIDIEELKIKSEFNLDYEKINFKFNINKIPISIGLSRKKYSQLKNYWESMICKFFNLGFNFNNDKKTIVLVEFNPEGYSELIQSMKNHDKNIVLLNLRKSAVWNFKSIKTLLNSNAKVINPEKLFTRDEKTKLKNLHGEFLKKLNSIWENDSSLREFFSIENYSLWTTIKNDFINIFNNRLEEYIFLVMLTKKIFEVLDVSYIVTLNESGETENALISINNKKKKTILLSHAFANYTPTSKQFDVLSDYRNLNDKIAVWGDIQKKYLVQQRGISEDRILVTGSPRHDLFFQQTNQISKNTSEKTILFSPRPIIELNGNGGTEKTIQYEEYIKKIFRVVRKLTGVKIIVKLHPQLNDRNTELRNIIKNADPLVPIFQLTSVIDLIQSCDVLVNLEPESNDMSTILLEAMILKKPIMTVTIDKKQHDMEFLKDNAVVSINDIDDFEKNIKRLLYNKDIREKLIQNSQKHIEKYLANHGTASKTLAKILNT